MKQKREVIVTICIADSPHDPVSDELITTTIRPSLEKLLGEENLLFIEHIENQWGEPV